MEKEAFQTMQKLGQSLYETYQAAVQSAFEMQNRTAQCTRTVFMDGFETMMGHIDAAPRLFQAAKQTQDQQETMPLSTMEYILDASKRNIAFMQKSINNAIDAFDRNSEIMRDLTQKSMEKTHEQQEMLLSHSM